MNLHANFVEKPWGRFDVPAHFGDIAGRRIGEICYESADSEPLPLLVKWLVTSEKLSIQVHPNDAQAYERGLNSGKEECWCVDDAAQLASCVPAGPWLVIPLEGPLICRDETVRMGDCILVHDLSCLNMSDDCRMLLTSWFMT